MGIPINDNLSLYTLHFAKVFFVLGHYYLVMAQDKEYLEYMTRKLIEEYEKWGLKLNKKKTRYICVGSELEDLILNNNIKIEACEEYMYLGVKIASKGRCEKKIEERIGKGRKVIGALNSVLWSRDISDHRKK